MNILLKLDLFGTLVIVSILVPTQLGSIEKPAKDVKHLLKKMAIINKSIVKLRRQFKKFRNNFLRSKQYFMNAEYWKSHVEQNQASIVFVKAPFYNQFSIFLFVILFEINLFNRNLEEI